jgi:DNA-binding NarL/FixJ family response regulator
VADRLDIASEQVEIVIADDHAMIRSGLRRVLDAEANLKVVAEAAGIDDALDQALRRRPRIVILDLNMPGAPTLPAIPRFLEASYRTDVIVLTMEHDPGIARRALSAGARGYVLKEAAEEELVEAVRAVLSGRTYLDPSLGARMATLGPQAAGKLPGLTDGDPHLAIGSHFAGHRIDAVVARGGQGLVFRATDRTLDRTVALKVIAPEAANDPTYRARFQRECRLAAAIDHPHVVDVFHAGEEDGLLYVTMRYVAGTDLRRLLRDEGRLEPARAIALLVQLGSALDEAHRLGLVHRDVKPGNVLTSVVSGREHAFLTDFGITKRAAEQPLTRTGLALGTVDYIAPEQAHGGDVDARADIYSLGCVVFETLTGELVFDRDNDLEKIWAHVHDPPPLLRSVTPDLPPGLEDVLERALAKEPRERYPSAGEFARAATAALGRHDSELQDQDPRGP